MRINFQGEDHSYTLLTKKIDSGTREIRISFNQEELTIVRSSTGVWDVLERTIGDNQGLFSAIASNIALRYRLR